MRGVMVVLTGVLTGLLVGCGSSGTKRAVTLSVLGGTSNLNAVACGKQEAFEQYAAPAQIGYTGTVSPAPSGRWKIKIKAKRCAGGTFVDSASQKIVGQTSGRFDGVISIPDAGAYSLRAELEPSGGPVSPKVYAQLR